MLFKSNKKPEQFNQSRYDQMPRKNYTATYTYLVKMVNNTEYLVKGRRDFVRNTVNVPSRKALLSRPVEPIFDVVMGEVSIHPARRIIDNAPNLTTFNNQEFIFINQIVSAEMYDVEIDESPCHEC